MNEPCKHERLGDLCHNALIEAQHERDEALATIERVRVIVDDPHAALVVDRVRAALEATS